MSLAEFLNTVRALAGELGVAGIADIAFMALVIYGLLVWLRRTRRAASALVGILIVAAVYLLARQFGMALTVVVLQGFFAVVVVVLIVVFQEELRSLFEAVAERSLRRRSDPSALVEGTEPMDILARTLADMSRDRVGALVVLPRADPLERHLEGGQELQGLVSEALLRSLFDPHSSGHDGAVVLEGDRISRFGCHLPLSKNHAALGQRGTRHAAALGLSERTDALCVVVSEERGTICVARRGRLTELADADAVRRALEPCRRDPTPGAPDWTRWITRNTREKFAAAGLAIALWFVLVHEARVVFETFRVPVRIAGLQPWLEDGEIVPDTVEVTLSGTRRSFHFVDPSGFEALVNVSGFDEGEWSAPLGASNFTVPPEFDFESVEPTSVRILITGPLPADR